MHKQKHKACMHHYSISPFIMFCWHAVHLWHRCCCNSGTVWVTWNTSTNAGHRSVIVHCLNPQPVTWGPFGPHSGLMAVYFRSPGSTTPFKVVVRPPNVYEEGCLFFHQGFHNVRRMQVWCGVQMDPNVSNVLVLVYLILFPGNIHFLFC